MVKAIFPILPSAWCDMAYPARQPTPFRDLPIATRPTNRDKVKAARRQSAKTRRKRK